MLHTKSQGHWPSGFGEEIFWRVFTIYGRGGHLGHVTIWTNFRSPILRSLHMKYEFNWPSSYRGEDVWKCWRTTDKRTDGRRSHWYTLGITHVFSCINICWVLRMLFEHEADRTSVQHHPRDPASVNAMKQTCVIVILAYFTLLQSSSQWKRF